MNSPALLRTIAAAALFLFLGAGLLPADARAPMLEARDNLERANSLLQQPHIQRPKDHENAVVAQLNFALAHLDQVLKNKGSQLPSAVKDVKAALTEVNGHYDDEHRAKALEYVQSALKHVNKGWENRGSH